MRGHRAYGAGLVALLSTELLPRRVATRDSPACGPVARRPPRAQPVPDPPRSTFLLMHAQVDAHVKVKVDHTKIFIFVVI